MSGAGSAFSRSPRDRIILTVRPTPLFRVVLLLNWPFPFGWLFIPTTAWVLLSQPGWPRWAGAVLGAVAVWGLVRAATARITITDRTVITANAFRTRQVVVEPGDLVELGIVELLHPTSRGAVVVRGTSRVPLLTSVVLTAAQQRALSVALRELAARTGCRSRVPTSWPRYLSAPVEEVVRAPRGKRRRRRSSREHS